MAKRQQALTDKNHWHAKLEGAQEELRRRQQQHGTGERIVQVGVGIITLVRFTLLTIRRSSLPKRMLSVNVSGFLGKPLHTS